MNLLIIRHAESNGNASGGGYSVENADSLSPRGMAQATALASGLASWEIDNVIVSPKHRALQTIAPYLAATGRTATVWPELAEACWHEVREPPAAAWNSQPTTLPAGIARHFSFRDGQAICPAHPHTFGSGLRRVHDALEKIERIFGQSKQTILVASHRFFISEMMNLMLQRPEPEAFDHDNCGMTLISFDKTWDIRFCNRHATENLNPV